MLENISLNFNWIDFLVIFIVIRVIYVGIKSKFLVEIFRLLGVLFAIFIALHFSWKAGYLLQEYVFMPEAICVPFSFLLLWVTSIIIFKLISNGWLLMFRFELRPVLNKCIGAFISSIRAILVASLMFMLVFTTGYEYLGRVANRSFTGPFLIDLAPNIYEFTYDYLISKCFPNEHLNVRVFNLKSLGRKKKLKK